MSVNLADSLTPFTPEQIRLLKRFVTQVDKLSASQFLKDSTEPIELKAELVSGQVQNLSLAGPDREALDAIGGTFRELSKADELEEDPHYTETLMVMLHSAIRDFAVLWQKLAALVKRILDDPGMVSPQAWRRGYLASKDESLTGGISYAVGGNEGGDL